MKNCQTKLVPSTNENEKFDDTSMETKDKFREDMIFEKEKVFFSITTNLTVPFSRKLKKTLSPYTHSRSLEVDALDEELEE